MKSVLAFGDSNTWGLVPGTGSRVRYPENVRWTGLLQSRLNDTRVIEEGLCGRTTVFEDELRVGRKGLSLLPVILESHAPLDAVIIMLGTNDCKSVYGASAHTIGKGIELCLDEIEKTVPAEKIILVSPIHLGDEVWRPDKDPEFDKDSIEVSHELREVYSRIAEKRGVRFLAASDIASPDKKDDEHLNEEGHKALSEAIYGKLTEINVA